MAEQAETVFVRTFLNNLSNQPVTYGDDYQQPLQNSLKRVPVLPIGLPAPPARKRKNVENTSAAITLTFKSLKPPKSFVLSVQPTDTIQSIKGHLASQPNAPPADVQRLLLKGKALADTKLLQEYTIKDGDTVNLMIKPGHTWDPNTPAINISAMSSSAPLSLPPLQPDAKPTPGHTRIPSVVLSPSPSATTPSMEVDKPLDINLTLDASQPLPAAQSSYHAAIADPVFWEKLNAFLKAEFKTETDGLLAFEEFLRASKGTLTASEIAKIRDHVGVVGMAGT
ncbi:ubiquitin-like protein [Athelia psychrophila]|uniref:Ubiquitin-like protein n=1 Tax=Athelia psychrophila TaxID=1759441 RepID=A0A166NGL6_9AGAM|nr:ubiquitin-like protein [Fibularhizoctonia sp. CBS 109695]